MAVWGSPEGPGSSTKAMDNVIYRDSIELIWKVLDYSRPHPRHL